MQLNAELALATAALQKVGPASPDNQNEADADNRTSTNGASVNDDDQKEQIIETQAPPTHQEEVFRKDEENSDIVNGEQLETDLSQDVGNLAPPGDIKSENNNKESQDANKFDRNQQQTVSDVDATNELDIELDQGNAAQESAVQNTANATISSVDSNGSTINNIDGQQELETKA